MLVDDQLEVGVISVTIGTHWKSEGARNWKEHFPTNIHRGQLSQIVGKNVKTYNMNKIIFLCVLAGLISVAFADTCQKPEIVASSYVTEDATVLTNVAFTMQFVLKCNNGVKGISLYAEVEGKTLPAVRLSADNKYQISWTEDIKKARSGDYYIKLYDEEKYVAVRKAIRNGEDPDSVNPLAVVVLNNPGVFLGPWVNSEFLAAFLAILVSYSAFSAKYKLLA